MASQRPGLPVSLYVTGRRCVVIGAGADADRRAATLGDAGARVERMSAATAAADGLAGVFLTMVVDAAEAAAVEPAARAAGSLFYVQDAPDHSDLALPAVHQRGPITLTVSTDAVAPALARHLRDELGRLVDAAGKAFDQLVEELRAARDAEAPGPSRRDRLFALAKRLRIDGRLVIDP